MLVRLKQEEWRRLDENLDLRHGICRRVSAACLARMGHEVIGVDVNRGKIDLINTGALPVLEEGLTELIAEGHRAGRISATDDPIEAVQKSEISLISVGMPTGAHGGQALGAIESVVASIGQALRRKLVPHTVVVRSTVMPRTTEERIAPNLEESSGQRLGGDEVHGRRCARNHAPLLRGKTA